MSQALYRKYRSQRFSELVGQESVTQILCNSIVRERLGHAYLFCGPRGTGKTSVARIFAKALNCLNSVDGDACGECVVCTGVAEGRAVDVIEIDAASNRGIDDIRELRERVGYAPLELKYKVYIIDEVHMITIQGFNALLKTLEEPPGHVVFCLCTTEAHKLPVTILSRCIRFDFRRIPLQKLADHLSWMAVEEGYELHPAAALRLGELSEGSARDAISLLDQLMVYCEKTITTSDMQELFQLGDPQLAKNTADQLAAGDPLPLLATWEQLSAQGADAGQFLLKVGEELKQRYLADTGAGWRRAMEAVWQGVNLLKYESFPAVLVELTLLNAQAAFVRDAVPIPPAAATPSVQAAKPPQRSAPPAEPAKPPAQAPVRAVDPTPAAAPRQQPAAAEPTPEPPAVDPSDPGPEPPPGMSTVSESAAPQPAPELPVTPPPQPVTTPAASHEAGADWEDFKRTVKETRTTAYAMLIQGATGWCEDGILTIEFPAESRTAYCYAQNAETSKALVSVAEQFYDSDTGVVLRLVGDKKDQAELKPRTVARKPVVKVLPPEITSDIVEDNKGDHSTPSGVDPGRMERDAASMSGQIGSERDDDIGNQPPTSQDFDTLFKPIDLDN